MYPYERSLVKRLQHEPFALIGVNSDQDLVKIKPLLEKDGVTWRSFADGGTSGPIAKAWGIRGWPTVHIIDAEGKLRYMNIHGDKDIDNALDTLLAEMKKTKKKDEVGGE